RFGESNVALCVNPNDTYCRVKAADGYTYYMAEALLDTVLGRFAADDKPAYEIEQTYTGKDLEYKEYEPLFPYVAPLAEKQHKKGFFVMCDDYVTMTDGTGIVHCASAFGEDDARVCKRYDTPFIQLVDTKGNMTAPTPYEGVFVKDADKLILQDLEKAGLLFDAPKFEHDYPHCWRCDTPLIYYARETWFIKMTAVKDDLIRNNNTINWIPESIGKGRFGNWLENVQDWGISRNRYWGTPLNVWECECGHRHVIGSIEELKSMSPDCPDDIELHRPFIDAVTVTCPACGKQMHRVPEVIDCWFDSGAMPFAQHHYPFENKELFESQFPADFISEAVDQTRGWFYSLLAISTLIFDKAPYKNVIVLGLVQDENGQKMSKSKGNAVDPMEALEKYGADAIRWYFYTNSAPWLPNRFYDKAVVEGQRKFMSTLWNTYSFYVLYANIDNFDPTKYDLADCRLTVMDRWLLSKLNSMVKAVDDNLANYRIPEAGKALQQFTDDLSNWYVRRGRERYWVQGLPDDKLAAYMVLYTALVTTAKTAAPMVPFLAEAIYRNLVCSVDKTAPESVHLCDFPTVDESAIDTALETNMDEVIDIVVLGRAARNGAERKNRQPLSVMYVQTEHRPDDSFVPIIRDELNVKQVEFISDASSLVAYRFKPQLRTLGPKYGKQLGEIREALAELPSSAKETLDRDGSLTLHLSSGDAVLAPDDLLIETEQKAGLYTVSDRGVTVALDTTLTDELVEEGYVNELISKIQTMRKDSGFEVTDRIDVTLTGNDKLFAVAEKNRDAIATVVLADSITAGGTAGHVKEWDINGERVTIGVTVRK
ncbi:MAG: isoleucine--tRNA ligase, partial [Clostridia bacterium]|nr:isoleucine--tRNA ligase [Clostridia bacterium]